MIIYLRNKKELVTTNRENSTSENVILGNLNARSIYPSTKTRRKEGRKEMFYLTTHSKHFLNG